MQRTLVSRSNALKDYLKLVAAMPRLDAGRLAELEAAQFRGDATATLALTEHFLALVVAEATARRGLGLRFEALIAAGNRGLSEALRRRGGDLERRVRRQVRRGLREALVRAARVRRTKAA